MLRGGYIKREIAVPAKAGRSFQRRIVQLKPRSSEAHFNSENTFNLSPVYAPVL